jgi:nitroimidazol reductase NimA-like FMN-containing flavoprotein (pyridoxamine 5'-phosphate oxidase superfamily)
MLGMLDQGRIEEILREEVVGRVGCHAHGRTYVVPITYAYADGCVYAHSAEGTKLRLMRANPWVCFEVERVRSPVDWESVIAQGRFEELQGEEAHAAMRLYLDRLAPLLVSATARLRTEMYPRRAHPPGDGHGAVVFRLRLSETSGRFETPLGLAEQPAATEGQPAAGGPSTWVSPPWAHDEL